MEPKIRFKGFEGEWKEANFKSFGHVAMCKRIFKYQTSPEGDIPFYKIGTFGSEPDAYISQRLFEEYKKKYSFPIKGDILISAAGTIGRTVEYNGENCYYQDSNIVWLAHNNNITNGFLKQLYSIVKWSSLEGATIKRLYNSNILETSFYIPQKSEQQTIAFYFTSLDSQISASTSRLASLKQMKAASLQAMFPQEGETVPKIRFKGFEGEWKKVKFSELYERSSIKNDLSFGTDKIISVANMYYINNEKQVDDDYLRSYNVMRLGDIAFEGHSSKEFAYGRLVENTIGDGIVSHVFVVMKPKSKKYDLNFWKYYINNENIMGNILCRCTKASTMMNDIVINDFLKESILVPSYEEQVEIGKILTSLDRQITLQTQRLEKLKQMKAACLDKMFV